MPNIDLGPDDYRKQDPKTGRWYVPDDPRAGFITFAISVICLIGIYLAKDSVTADNLFWGVAIFAFGGGTGFYLWLKHIH